MKSMEAPSSNAMAEALNPAATRKIPSPMCQSRFVIPSSSQSKKQGGGANNLSRPSLHSTTTNSAKTPTFSSSASPLLAMGKARKTASSPTVLSPISHSQHGTTTASTSSLPMLKANNFLANSTKGGGGGGGGGHHHPSGFASPFAPAHEQSADYKFYSHMFPSSAISPEFMAAHRARNKSLLEHGEEQTQILFPVGAGPKGTGAGKFTAKYHIRQIADAGNSPDETALFDEDESPFHVIQKRSVRKAKERQDQQKRKQGRSPPRRKSVDGPTATKKRDTKSPEQKPDDATQPASEKKVGGPSRSVSFMEQSTVSKATSSSPSASRVVVGSLMDFLQKKDEDGTNTIINASTDPKEISGFVTEVHKATRSKSQIRFTDSITLDESVAFGDDYSEEDEDDLLYLHSSHRKRGGDDDDDDDDDESTESADSNDSTSDAFKNRARTHSPSLNPFRPGDHLLLTLEREAAIPSSPPKNFIATLRDQQEKVEDLLGDHKKKEELAKQHEAERQRREEHKRMLEREKERPVLYLERKIKEIGQPKDLYVDVATSHYRKLSMERRVREAQDKEKEFLELDKRSTYFDNAEFQFEDYVQLLRQYQRLSANDQLRVLRIPRGGWRFSERILDPPTVRRIDNDHSGVIELAEVIHYFYSHNTERILDEKIAVFHQQYLSMRVEGINMLIDAVDTESLNTWARVFRSLDRRPKPGETVLPVAASSSGGSLPPSPTKSALAGQQKDQQSNSTPEEEQKHVTIVVPETTDHKTDESPSRETTPIPVVNRDGKVYNEAFAQSFSEKLEFIDRQFLELIFQRESKTEPGDPDPFLDFECFVRVMHHPARKGMDDD